MNSKYRKPLPGTSLDYFDARAAVEAIRPGAWDALPYTSRVHAENLVRRADPAMLDAYLAQLIERRRDLDFPARPHWSTSPACAMRSRTWAAIRRRSIRWCRHS